MSCVVEAGKAVSMSPSIGPIGPIERDILTALLFCARIPDFKIMQLNTFSIFVRWRMQTRFKGIECFNVATPVAYSDSFTNCHLCRSYVNSITNDERHIKVRYCSNIVRWTSIRSPPGATRRVYMPASYREGVYTCKHATANARSRLKRCSYDFNFRAHALVRYTSGGSARE